MSGKLFYSVGGNDALAYAVAILKKQGLSFSDTPHMAVSHLLLAAPATVPDGVLEKLPQDITVIGGNLDDDRLSSYKKIDLLKDPIYLSENACITAYCAIGQATRRLPVTLQHCPVLVIGWGRIGKCLAQLLKQMCANVTVAARKETDIATLTSLNYNVLYTQDLASHVGQYRLIFNTAPAMVLAEEESSHCSKDCLKIDLASRLGMSGQDVIWARGLPAKDAPQSSGELIAKTILRLLDKQ